MTQLVPRILAQLDESLFSTPPNKIVAVVGQGSFMLIKSIAFLLLGSIVALFARSIVQKLLKQTDIDNKTVD